MPEGKEQGGERELLGAGEIVVHHGHLTIFAARISDGWYARMESSIEGPIFEGRVEELSDLLMGNVPEHPQLDEKQA
ncbi:MAG: hypothetical protein VW450_05205 [Chloroflexota bacterium]